MIERAGLAEGLHQPCFFLFILLLLLILRYMYLEYVQASTSSWQPWPGRPEPRGA
jgi:hypothetical protein